MDWEKIKTILIILFLAINISLVGRIFHTNYIKTQISPQVVEDAVQILKKNNVEIDKNIINTKMEYFNAFQIKAFEHTNSENLKKLVGEDVKVVQNKDKRSTSFEGAEGVLTLTDVLSLSFEKTVKDKKVDITDKQKIKKIATDLVTLIAQNECDIMLSDQIYDGGVSRLIFKQVIEGVTIENTQLAITFWENGTIKGEGKWVVGEVEAQGMEQLISPLNALLMFTMLEEQKEKKTILSIEPLYIISSDTMDNTIIPVYKIQDSLSKSTYINAFTGTEVN